MWRQRARTDPLVVADWLILLGGVGLFASLFLTWSHQLSPGVLAAAAGSGALRGVPADPTAWQVYSVADELLALLAAALVIGALAGSMTWRLVVLGACWLALAFTLHALAAPPTNGVLLVGPGAKGYVARPATAGVGETLALVSLALAASGLGVSLVRR